MTVSADQSFGKRQRTPAEEPRNTDRESSSWRKAMYAMLLSGLVVLVHRALVPKPRNNTTSPGTGADGESSDSPSDGGGGD